MDITDFEDNESQNLEDLHEMRSNRTNTIMNNQTNQKKPGDEMIETAENLRKEKKAEKKFDVNLNDIQEYLNI